MNTSAKENLKNIIHSTLNSLINDDYILLDVPDHNNIGDNLIWQGELDYLKQLNYKKLCEISSWFYNSNLVPSNGIFLFHGGGNLGDLYPESHDLRLKIIENNHDRRIIILPQSLHYDNLEKLQKDVKIFSGHPDLHICLRDFESFILLKKLGVSNIYLVPDMAFCIDFSKYNLLHRKTGKILYMRRNDKEFIKSNTEDNIMLIKSLEVKDWPTFNFSKTEHRIRYRVERYNRILSKKIIKIPLLNKLVDSRYGLKSRIQRQNYIKTGITFINDYDTIITTRLHGLILGILLNKEVKKVIINIKN